jgi:hypothetical protein
MKIGEYDDGYDDAFPEIDGKAMLYVMGAIDELRAIGIVETIAGDEPLTNHKQRKLYRQLKCDSFTPTVAEVEAIVTKCVCADDQECFLTLLRGVVEKGWKHVRQLHAEQKVQDARNAEIRRTYGLADDGVPL